MKIEMRCPNGHREIIEDSRFGTPDSQKVKFWLSQGRHCRECDETWSEAYEFEGIVVRAEVVTL